jgi:SAM-dependent methyltransferase
MAETFPREAAANPEPFTGERLTASIHGQVEIEHYHRYLFCRGFCRDRDVLDVASGEGYGAAQLSQVANFVVGVEYASQTAVNAAVNFAKPNLRFLSADARSLPLSDTSVDVVTSFETIEHFDRQDDFVAEVRRVLRPDGCFIVSTPDRDVYSPPGAPPNPFHVREFNRSEFLDLLHRHFRYVCLVRQRPVLASGLIPEEAASISPLIFERVDDGSFLSDTTLPKAPYLLAIASELTPRLAPFSLFIEHSDIDNVHVADDMARLAERCRQADAEREQFEVERQIARSALESARETAQAAVEAEREAARAAIEAEQEAARVAIEAAKAAARVAIEAIEAEKATAHAAVEAAERRTERAESDAKAIATTLTHTRGALVQANNDLDRISGSARHFLWQYIPRLWHFLAR